MAGRYGNGGAGYSGSKGELKTRFPGGTRKTGGTVTGVQNSVFGYDDPMLRLKAPKPVF
jgi:hypothetical protein